MFYWGGDYEARKGSGIEQSISLHPAATATALARGRGTLARRAVLDELAVMVDTFRPLSSARARGREDPAYPWSWQDEGRRDDQRPHPYRTGAG
jgi:homogentisate 1,2-dioxygenase